jgi:hypothetical protein
LAVLPALTIVIPPGKGTVRFDTAEFKPPQCTNTIKATAVFYKPSPGFVGQDLFTFERKGDAYTLGFDRRTTVTVTVQ